MPWICPVCGRSFRNTHQSHSCATVPIEKHFLNRPPELKLICERILDQVRAIGTVQVNVMNGAILVAGQTTFLALKVKKDHVELEILSDREITEFPIYKTFRVSRSRVALFVKVQQRSEIDAQLMSWISEAMRIIGKSTAKSRIL
jgi:hypothetical protein